MPDSADGALHVKPYVYEANGVKALHFSIHEIQSSMQTARPYGLALEYTRTMMAFLLLQAQPSTVAMIGLGGGSMAKFAHRFLPQSRIKVLEINPHVIALRDAFNVPADDERFVVRHADGAEFVRKPPYLQDVLLVDGFDDQGQPPALCSQRFYDDCFETLSDTGLMVANLHAGHKHFDAHLARIERSFGEDKVLFVKDSERSNAVVFACKGSQLQDFKPAPLRQPPSFDGETWGELMPAFAKLAAAIKDKQAATQ